MLEESYYDILGIPSSATPEEITAAYRNLARLHHPDRNPDLDTTRTMQRINQAYHVLNDPQRRAAYDQGRRQPQNRHGIVRIYRTGAPVAVSRNLQVLLNGKKLGDLAWNGAEQFVIEPGVYELSVQLDSGSSPTVPFTCQAGQVVNFECGAGSIFGTLFAAFSSSSAFYLRQH